MYDLNKLKEIAMKAAFNTGVFLSEEKYNEKKIYEEQGRDIKLEIDREAENLIRKDLEDTDIKILGEEFGGQASSEIKWVIDPIDGTSNYFRGLDQCCISIALMEKEKSIIGIIYNFNTNEMYHSHKQGGAFLNDNKISVSNIIKKNKASIVTGFPASETIESTINFLENLKVWKKVRMFGSAALSCAYVASGKCDFYAEKGIYLWDFAAGICLVEEAGGRAEFSYIDGDRYSVKFSNGKL